MVYIVLIGNKDPCLFTENFSFDFHSFNNIYIENCFVKKTDKMGTKLIIIYSKCLQAVHALSDMKHLAASLVDM